MFGMGFSEIMVILVVALLFLGPEKLPQAAKTISRGIRDLRKQTRELQETLEDDTEIGDAIRDLQSALRGEEHRNSKRNPPGGGTQVASATKSTQESTPATLPPASQTAASDSGATSATVPEAASFSFPSGGAPGVIVGSKGLAHVGNATAEAGEAAASPTENAAVSKGDVVADKGAEGAEGDSSMPELRPAAGTFARGAPLTSSVGNGNRNGDAADDAVNESSLSTGEAMSSAARKNADNIHG